MRRHAEMPSCSTTGGGYLTLVKTATIQQVPEQWADILKWVVAGEEVQMTDHDKVVAKIIPAAGSQPDFVERAKTIWGEKPPGEPLSAVVAGGRGCKG
jgi:antitoxin (DNA-binding transcriptional repressor) of toxin-antitoxin stability system